MEKIKFNQTENEFIITISKKKNYSLDELKQKTINHLYSSNLVDSNEVDLLKILLENKSESSKCSDLDYKKVGINFYKS